MNQTNVTIGQLAEFLRKYGDSLLDGSSTLCLTTSCLCDLQRSFSMLDTEHPESDSFRVVACDTGSHVLQDLVFLHDILQKSIKLKLVTTPKTVQGELNLSKFGSLRHLECQRVPPHLITGLSSIAGQLDTLGAHRVLTSVQPLLNLSGGKPWTKLETLRLSLNALETFGKDDSNFELLPSLKNLDLSHNQMTELDLTGLESLVCLDLSFNFIDRVPHLHRRSSFLSLSYLSMSHNVLEDLQGLEALAALKVLDVSFNMISDFNALEPMANLMQLDKLFLEGNPISYHEKYTTNVAPFIAKTVILDNRYDVHSGRMTILTSTSHAGQPINIEYNSRNSEEDEDDDGTVICSETPVSNVGSVRARPSLIGEFKDDRLDERFISKSLEASHLRREMKERRKAGGDFWLLREISSPTAHSTPYEDRMRTRKESKQSDDCVVVSETASVKSLEAMNISQYSEAQPEGACVSAVMLMTTSQTESAGDIVEDLGTPIHVGESDKEESPAIGVLKDEPDVEVTETTELISTLIDLSIRSNQTITPKHSEGEISSSGSDSSVGVHVEEESPILSAMRDKRKQNASYDFEHTIDNDSRMILELTVFPNDETFVAAFRGFMVVMDKSFEGYVVLSNKRVHVIGTQVKTEGVLWSSTFRSISRATLQLGSQSILIESQETPDSKWVLAYMGDTSWCSQLAQQLSLRMPNSAAVRRTEVSPQDVLALLHLESSTLNTYCQGYWSLLDDYGGKPQDKSYLCIAIAGEDVVVVREKHIEPEKVYFMEICAQSITALTSIAIDEDNMCIANIVFTDETSNRDQVWYYESTSVASMLCLIDSLRQPWKEIFEVDVPIVSIKRTD